MDENLARKIAKKRSGNPFAGAGVDDDDEVGRHAAVCHIPFHLT